ncbi:MAG: YihY family inner membrane protein, partial [Gammaproteobacteria bacterium]|nr:YihY family inner membrane protein [Gammaproteobacteria bacterium]
VIFSALSVLPVFDQMAGRIETFVFSNFVPSSGQILQQYLASFEAQARRLPSIAFAFLFVTALLMMFNVEDHLNEVWKVSIRRRFSISILVYWAMLTLGPLFLGLSLAVSSYLGSLAFFQGVNAVGGLYLWQLLPWISAFLAFMFLYTVVPNCAVKWSHAAIGALVATILFEAAKSIFGFYVRHFPTYEVLYGALAIIPIFLIWLYCSWMILLLGAEVVNGLATAGVGRDAELEHPLVLTYRVLGRLFEAQKTGQAVSFLTLFNQEGQANFIWLRRILDKLIAMHWVAQVNSDEYVLNCDLHDHSFYELYLATEWRLPAVKEESGCNDVPYCEALVKLLKRCESNHAIVLNVPLATLYGSSKRHHHPD